MVMGARLALLPSKYPIVFGTYSSQKFLAIAVCFASGISLAFGARKIVGFLLKHKFSSKAVFLVERSCEVVQQRIMRNEKQAMVLIFLLTALFFLILSVARPIAILDDLAPQLKSLQQWKDGVSSNVNSVVRVSREDLSQDVVTWNLRPPGAPLVFLPLLLLGVSVGVSARIVKFCFLVLGGLGWMKVTYENAKSLRTKISIAAILILEIGGGLFAFGSVNIIIYGIIPWLLIYALHIVKRNEIVTLPAFNIIPHMVLLSALLGGLCWIKFSSLIATSTIFVFAWLRIVFKNRRPLFSRNTLSFICAAIIFIMPYLLIEFLNQNMGMFASKMYASQDYNNSAYLYGHGKYFQESTRGYMLLLSVLGSPGFSMCSGFLTCAKNFFLLNPNISKFFYNTLRINGSILLLACFGNAGTVFLFFLWNRTKKTFAAGTSTMFLTFFTMPFLVLGYLSLAYGFNWSLSFAHTVSFFSILQIFVLICFFERKKILKGRAVRILFLGFMFCGFIFPYVSSFLTQATGYARLIKARTRESGQYTATQHALYSPRLSRSNAKRVMDLVKRNSVSEKDVVFVITTGNPDVVMLDVDMRYAGTGFVSSSETLRIGKRTTKENLRLFLVIDPALRDDRGLVKKARDSFAQATGWQVLNRDSREDALVIYTDLKV